jgi:Spermine/spermidine synthase domain
VSTRPAVRALVGIGLVAGCALALQVLLTRLFSAVLFYHFGFLAISLALLGTGVGGLALYVRPQWFERHPLQVALSRWSALLAGLLVLVPLALVRLDYSFDGNVTAGFALNLGAACVLAALPFTAAGVAIALAIRDYARFAGRVYAADLVGAGIGAAAVVPVMWIADPATLTVALGALAALAALLFGGARRLAPALLVIAAALVVVSAATSLYHLDPVTKGRTVADRWTPLSRVVGYPPQQGSRYAILFYDRVYAPVPVHRPGTAYPTARRLGLIPQSIGYGVTGPGRTLVIGGGGGRDIFNALTAGQRQVDVIELNQGIVDVVDKDLRRWSGSPYTLPHVQTSVGDGRSILAARDIRYDQIHIGFTDTLSANSATAFALTENNLYTTEAFDEYFDHLRPDGILNVSRLYRLVGDEALRATVLTMEALRGRGVEHPERNVVVLLGHDILGELFGTVLARPRAWTAAELARMRELAARDGVQIAMAPGGPYRLEWSGLHAAASPAAFCAAYRMDVCAPTDDKPFFFNMRRFEDLGQAPPPGYLYSIDPFRVLLLTLGILAVLCAIGFVLPLAAVRGVASRPRAGALSFFAFIGLGFLLLEVVLIQRFVLFLGFPTYALSVVLFALLVFTGLGALLAERLSARDGPRRTLIAALAGVIVLTAAAAFGLQPLLRGLIDLPFAARVAASVALLAPAGLGMGMAMPIGIRRLVALHPTGVPWAWAVNGLTSVLASALAVAIAITAGFAVATLAACACYAAALLHAARGRWPTADAGAGLPADPGAAPERELEPSGPGRSSA